LLRRSTILKRRTFPWAVCAMLAAVGIGALGAAADPGRPNLVRSMGLSDLIGAMAGLAFIRHAFSSKRTHQRASCGDHDILAEVKRIRSETRLRCVGNGLLPFRANVAPGTPWSAFPQPDLPPTFSMCARRAPGVQLQLRVTVAVR